jgi:uncharacterized cofD-like protein
MEGKVKRLWLEPNNPSAFPPAIQAILSAELILVGPGSLFTSILPNLLVPDLSEALRASKAVKFYICNLATQPGETDGYTCGDHIRKIEEYVGSRTFDLIVCNQKFDQQLPNGVEWVKPESFLQDEFAVYFANLVDKENPWRHDSLGLARVIFDLFYERTGPLVSKEEM